MIQYYWEQDPVTTNWKLIDDERYTIGVVHQYRNSFFVYDGNDPACTCLGEYKSLADAQLILIDIHKKRIENYAKSILDSLKKMKLPSITL